MSDDSERATPRPSTAVAHENNEPTPVQKKAMRNSILSHVLGVLGQLSFSSGLMLLYLKHQEFSDAQTMFFLSIPSLVVTLCLLPASFFADRFGLKRVLMPGTVISTLGFGLITLSSFLSGASAMSFAVLGAIFFSIGIALFMAPWFALLGPIIPTAIRGRYFGIMRVIWQSSGFLFGFGCTFLLSQDSPAWSYQIIFAVITFGVSTRIYFMSMVPEVEKHVPSREPVFLALIDIARRPGYSSFCCYVFLITLVTDSVPALFALIEKNTLEMGDQTIMWMGNLLMLGAISGFWLGGKAVDRLSTKPVFLIAHFMYGLLMFGFIARNFLPLAVLDIWIGFINFLFGLTMAASSIAISTEMMALIPLKNKSLSTGLMQTLQGAGRGFAGLLCSGVIALKMFAPNWSLWGAEFSGYDTMLFFCAFSILVLTVALGLVPSVIRRHEFLPHEE